MSGAELGFDLLLIGLLLGMALGTLYVHSLRAAIALFAAFGMTLALVWARLGAPDLALAEAAIGAGLTSTLLLRAASISMREPPPAPPRQAALAWLFLGVMAAWLAIQFLPLAQPTDRAMSLPAAARDALPESGVTHPVTAVLLNFRAWDTLLELIVLLLALLGFRQIARHNRHAYDADRHPPPWPLLQAWSRALAPLLVVTGGYLLWQGSSAPGGAFQAGAVLASALVLLRLSRQLPAFHWSQWPVRLAVLGGVLLFLAVAVAGLYQQGHWLAYPEGHDGLLIVLIESVATVSIAVTLAFLVAGEEEDIAR